MTSIRTLCATGIIISLLASGCARTRLGALIPAHVRSEKNKGELVTAQYFQEKSFTPVKPPEPPKDKVVDQAALMGGAGAIAAKFAADFLVDSVKKELLREAESYEHQYKSRLLLTTNDLGDEGVIVITRWIDASRSELLAGKRGVRGVQGRSIYANASQDAPKAFGDLVPADSTQVKAKKADQGIQDLLASPPAGKKPAAILTLRVMREGTSLVYRISGAKLWVATVGAKVVDFGAGNSWKVWQWAGGLLLATDAQVQYEASMNVKALLVDPAHDASGKLTNAKWAEVKPESGVLSSTKLNLNQLPKVVELGNNVGAWMAVPTVSTTGNERIGFVVMDFTFTERDTSNAKKYVTEAAEGVEKNRGNVQDAIKNLLGGN